MRWLLAVLIAASLFGGQTRADSGSIRLRPLGTLSGVLGAELELTPADHLGVGPTVHHARGSNPDRGSTLDLWELGLKASWFFADVAARAGWYASACLLAFQSDVQRVLASGNAGRLQYWSPGAALLGGHQWQVPVLGERWSFRAGLGLGYRPPYSEKVATVAGPEPMAVARRLDVAMDLTLGWNF